MKLTSLMGLTYDLEGFKKDKHIVITDIEIREYVEISKVNAYTIEDGKLIQSYKFDDERNIKYTVKIEFLDFKYKRQKYDYMEIKADDLVHATKIYLDFIENKEGKK